MKQLFSFLFLLVVFATGLIAQESTVEPKVSLQFPKNPVSDVANFYEILTKKRLIRDSNLTGPELSIVVPELVTKQEAISLIESAMLLNGYTLVSVDAHTSKLLGTTKQARNESIPLYADAAELPAGEQIVSFFMPFRFIASEEAAKIFGSYVKIRDYGAIVPAPNANALIITENVPLIRRLIALRQVIDVPSVRSTTEFFPLQRADAEKVASTLQSILKSKEGSSSENAPKTIKDIVADSRTNRVIVVAPEQEMPYIRELIRNLDISVAFEEPFERPLRFVAAGEVLPVLANLLDEEPLQSSGTGGSVQRQVTPADITGLDGGVSQNITSQGIDPGAKPDRLRDPAQSTAPLSIVAGKSRIIADRSSNKIIVIGPPEDRAKAGRVLDMLDKKPKQIYLATVIGQLTLGDGLNAGIKYPGSVTGNIYIGGGNGNGSAVATSQAANQAATTTGGILNNGGVDIVPGTSQLLNTAINLAAGSMSGLSIYGVIADSIDITVSALQSTNRFKVISRPVIYTANNKKAVISSGQQVPIPVSSLTSSLAVGAEGTSIASNIAYKDVVLKLEVIPLINSNNEVTLTIAQQNDNVQETVAISDNEVPVIGTQELTTTVTVPNRHTIVIGGLITEEEREIQTGLPFLSKIPGLNYLFGSKEKNIVRRELIIMIQPFIIEDDAQLQEANYVERANSSFSSENLYEGKIPVKRALLPVMKPSDRPARSTKPTWQEDPIVNDP